MAADAKIGFDDNASFRHKELHAKRDETQEDPREVAVCVRTPHWTIMMMKKLNRSAPVCSTARGMRRDTERKS